MCVRCAYAPQRYSSYHPEDAPNVPQYSSSALPVQNLALTSVNHIDALVSANQWSATHNTPTNITYTFAASGEGAVFSSSYHTYLLSAMQSWGNVANVTFTQTSTPSAAELTFANFNMGDPTLAGYMQGYSSNNLFTKTEIAMNSQVYGSTSNYVPGVTGDAYLTLLHEIGHALGLKHPGNYGGGQQGPFLPLNMDSSAYTVMSYDLDSNTNPNNPTLQFGESYSETPMIYDIAAVQYIYGVNTSYNSGNTTYTMNGAERVYTIWDGAGSDTISFAGSNFSGQIDLREGVNNYSRIEATIVWNAFGTNIENAIGGNGNDTITGNTLNNRIEGGSGNDMLYGEGGNDTITGNALGNILNGGAGSDQILGEAGNDTLFGGTGNDTLYGGDGVDTLVFSSSSANDTVLEFQGAGVAGGDIIRIAANLDGSTLTTQAAILAATTYASGNTVINLGSGNLITLLGTTTALIVSDFQIVGTPLALANDTLVGTSGNDTLFGELGNDSISGGNGADVLYGDFLYFNDPSGGNDTIDGDEGNDFIYGGFNIDILYGNIGNDTIFGNASNDVIYGDTNQTFLTNGGNDSIDGGDGNDTIYSGFNLDIVFGGLGNDTIFASAGNDVLYGDSNQTFLVTGGNDFIDGGEDNDTLFGAGGNDSLYGNIGNDVVFGGVGDDSLFGDTSSPSNVSGGQDAIHGESGNDTIEAGAGFDFITGGDGADLIFGWDGGDLMYGDSNQNQLAAGGNDTLIGGLGADVAYGGGGNDSVVGNEGVDSVYGDAGNDIIYGDFTNPDSVAGDSDYLGGGDGNDLMYGGAGNDWFAGGAGVDSMYGGAGDDLFVSNAGLDNIYGGTGSDIFNFQTGSGADYIYGFEGAGVAGGDVLQIKAALNGSAITNTATALAATTYSGGSTFINLGGGNQIVLFGNTTALVASDFQIF